MPCTKRSRTNRTPLLEVTGKCHLCFMCYYIKEEPSVFLCRSKVSLGLFAGQDILVLNHFTLNSAVFFMITLPTMVLLLNLICLFMKPEGLLNHCNHCNMLSSRQLSSVVHTRHSRNNQVHIMTQTSSKICSEQRHLVDYWHILTSSWPYCLCKCLKICQFIFGWLNKMRSATSVWVLSRVPNWY